jgi:ABC-type antimicrobial peptide transport system permease subunit
MRQPGTLLFLMALLVLAPGISRATAESVNLEPALTGSLILEGALTVANAMAWARNGNEITGVVGTFLGALQFAIGLSISPEDPSDYKVAFMTVGALGAIAGVGSTIRASRVDKAEDRTRVQVSPRLDLSHREFGLQLIARW